MNLEINLLRALALMQNQGEDFFILNDVAYKGTEQEAREQFEEASIPFDGELSEDDFIHYCQANLEEVEELDPDDYNNDYMVLTDEEAEEKWDEDLENYIDECILHELPKQYQSYFDREAWKRDARYDGRGHSLGRYDGNEDEEHLDIDGEKEVFYIYRIN